MELYRIQYSPILAVEPTREEIRSSSEKLAAWYNEPANRRLMTSEETTLPGEIPGIYSARAGTGGRNFLIYLDNRLIGDADIRNKDSGNGKAEFAIMIGEASDRGLGLGTKAAAAVHHFAFSMLKLKMLHLTVAGFNRGAVRSYEKLGYLETSFTGSGVLKEHPADILMSLEAENFYRLNPGVKTALISVRHPAR